MRQAVRKVLSDPSYKAKAKAIQAEFTQHDAASEAAVLLERLALTRQPVVQSAQLRLKAVAQ